MTAKVFVLTSTVPTPVQVGSTWYAIGDAAGDIRGGDFWREMRKLFPEGTILKEIRIVPDEPRLIKWSD